MLTVDFSGRPHFEAQRIVGEARRRPDTERRHRPPSSPGRHLPAELPVARRAERLRIFRKDEGAARHRSAGRGRPY